MSRSDDCYFQPGPTDSLTCSSPGAFSIYWVDAGKALNWKPRIADGGATGGKGLGAWLRREPPADQEHVLWVLWM